VRPQFGGGGRDRAGGFADVGVVDEQERAGRCEGVDEVRVPVVEGVAEVGMEGW
jgi:hypothetical protein